MKWKPGCSTQRLAWRNTFWYLFQIALLFNGSCYQWEWVPWASQKEMSLEVNNSLGLGADRFERSCMQMLYILAMGKTEGNKRWTCVGGALYESAWAGSLQQEVIGRRQILPLSPDTKPESEEEKQWKNPKDRGGFSVCMRIWQGKQKPQGSWKATNWTEALRKLVRAKGVSNKSTKVCTIETHNMWLGNMRPYRWLWKFSSNF